MSYPNLSTDDIDAITRFFNYVDTDNDGYISVSEIRAACGVDINGDGVVSVDEANIGSQPWLDAFVKEDKNGDDKLSLDELLAYNNDNV